MLDPMMSSSKKDCLEKKTHTLWVGGAPFHLAVRNKNYYVHSIIHATIARGSAVHSFNIIIHGRNTRKKRPAIIAP